MTGESRLAWVAALAAAALAVAVYVNSLSNGFAFDDVPIIQRNPFVHGHGGLRGILLESYWPFSNDLYRPVVIASFAADWWLSGGEPFLFHLQNVILHSLVSVLVFLLIRRLGAGAVAAGLGAVVFAVHPVHVEAVANIVGRAELISTLLFLAACLIYLRESSSVKVRAGLIAVCYFLALGSKEIAVSLPAVLFLLDLFLTRDLTARTLREVMAAKLPIYVGLLLSLGAYLGLRTYVLGSARGTGNAAYFDDVSTIDRLATAVRLWPEFLRLLFWPRSLAIEWGPAVLSPTNWRDPLVWAALILGIGIVGLAFAMWRKERWITLAAAWFAITIFLVSQIPFAIGVMIAERHLYLPSVAVSLLVPALVALFRTQAAWLRYSAVGAMAVVVALAMVRTWERNPTWESTRSAYMTLGREHPSSFRAAWYAAALMLRMDRLDDALPLFRRAAALMANRYYILNIEYADALLKAGMNESADSILRKSIEVAPSGARAYLFLAESLIYRERFLEAVEVLRTGSNTAIDAPEFDLAFTHHMALALDGAGKFDSALAWRRRGLADEEGRPFYQEWLHLARLGKLLGDSVMAHTALDSARTVAPDSIRPYLTLSPLPELNSALIRTWGELQSETGL